MKSHYLWIWLLLVLNGCVGSAIVPSQHHLMNVRQVYVVAMEAPPLGLPSRYRSVVESDSGFGPLIPIQAAGGSIPLVRAFGVVNTILVFIQFTESSHRTYETSKLNLSVIDTKDIWTPTVALANEASRQLTANGITTEVLPGVRPIPGVEYRGATWLMENWLAPIRSYYNYTGPVESYRNLALSADRALVLEVSISNYEITSDKLLLQVHLKAIDPRSGEVVGRARSYDPWNMPSLEPIDQALANDASRFKEIFAMTGRDLVKEALGQLGLVPER